MDETKLELEQFIDRCGLSSIVEMISEICCEKAEHIETNWQDPQTAKPWTRDARRLERLKLEN